MSGDKVANVLHAPLKGKHDQDAVQVLSKVPWAWRGMCHGMCKSMHAEAAAGRGATAAAVQACTFGGHVGGPVIHFIPHFPSLAHNISF
jgi:hypothetical protein